MSLDLSPPQTPVYPLAPGPSRLGLSLLCLGVLWLAPLALLGAQDREGSGSGSGLYSSDWVPVEGRSLGLAEYTTLRTMMDSGNQLLQEEALDSLESALRSGKTGGTDPNSLGLLAILAIGPLETVSADRSSGLRVDPSIRLRSIRLLRLAGGPGTSPLLFKSLELEQDPAVLAEVYDSLSGLGLAPDPSSQAIIGRHLRDPLPNGPHPGLMGCILDYIGRLDQSSSPVWENPVFEGLIYLAADRRQTKNTRQAADRLLRRMLGLPSGT